MMTRMSWIPRCAWSNKASDRLKKVQINTVNRFGLNPHPETYYVLPEYEGSLRRYFDKFRRLGPRPLIFVAVCLALMLGAMALDGDGALQIDQIGAAVGLILLGLGTAWFRGATPETVASLGVAAARRLALTVGLLTAALGFTLLFIILRT